MGNDGFSCGCIIGLIFAALVLRICWSIGEAWGISPAAIFISAFVIVIILLYLLGTVIEHFESERNRKYNDIQTKYPKAFAKYLAEKGQSDPTKAPNSFKGSVVKRQEIIWENEELALIKEEENRKRKEEEEKQTRLNNELKLIESQFPNGTRLLKERFPLYTVEYLVRNKSLISNLEDEYKAEQERKREEEEKKKKENRIRLAPGAPKVLLTKVQSWEHLYGSFHYTWLFYYYPTTCDFEPPYQDCENRRIVWNFKNDPERHIMPAIHERAIDLVLPQIKQKLSDTFGEEYLQFLTLVCLPASTSAKNQARYEDFSSQLCAETGMDNGYPHTYITKDGLSKNDPNNTSRRSVQPEVRFDDWFKGKLVLLFDDIVTKGGTMLRYKEMLERKGATIIGGIALGKTKHEPPENQRFVPFEDDIALF